MPNRIKTFAFCVLLGASGCYAETYHRHAGPPYDHEARREERHEEHEERREEREERHDDHHDHDPAVIVVE